MRTSLWRYVLSGLLGASLLSGCGTIERPDGGLAPPGSALHMVDPRIAAATLRAGFVERMGPGKPLTILAMSGGGANGAYGAGVIVGWTHARQPRPEFTIVTGVSTGALA